MASSVRKLGALAALFVVLAFALTAAAQAVEGARARVRRRPPPDDIMVPVSSRLVAHEWGVWLLEHGRVAHFDELARESPAFVYRAPNVPQPAPLPGPGIQPPRPPHGVIARKPVLFLRADRATHFRVEVGFSGGQPWLYYPSAQVAPQGIAPGSPSLVFTGTVLPSGQAALAQAPHGHFWNDLRAGGGDLIATPDGTAERFLFYDGPVAFEPSFAIRWRGNGAQVSPTSTETSLWLVDGGRFTESAVQGTTSAQTVAQGDMTALRQRLNAELMRRGLTASEARSLLETWRDSLFRDASPRAIYFVPRAAYDRMLPIRITPTPAELVRVGLVVEALAPRTVAAAP